MFVSRKGSSTDTSSETEDNRINESVLKSKERHKHFVFLWKHFGLLFELILCLFEKRIFHKPDFFFDFNQPDPVLVSKIHNQRNRKNLVARSQLCCYYKDLSYCPTVQVNSYSELPDTKLGMEEDRSDDEFCQGACFTNSLPSDKKRIGNEVSEITNNATVTTADKHFLSETSIVPVKSDFPVNSHEHLQTVNQGNEPVKFNVKFPSDVNRLAVTCRQGSTSYLSPKVCDKLPGDQESSNSSHERKCEARKSDDEPFEREMQNSEAVKQEDFPIVVSQGRRQCAVEAANGTASNNEQFCRQIPEQSDALKLGTHGTSSEAWNLPSVSVTHEKLDTEIGSDDSYFESNSGEGDQLVRDKNENPQKISDQFQSVERLERLDNECSLDPQLVDKSIVHTDLSTGSSGLGQSSQQFEHAVVKDDQEKVEINSEIIPEMRDDEKTDPQQSSNDEPELAGNHRSKTFQKDGIREEAPRFRRGRVDGEVDMQATTSLCHEISGRLEANNDMPENIGSNRTVQPISQDNGGGHSLIRDGNLRTATGMKKRHPPKKSNPSRYRERSERNDEEQLVHPQLRPKPIRNYDLSNATTSELGESSKQSMHQVAKDDKPRLRTHSGINPVARDSEKADTLQSGNEEQWENRSELADRHESTTSVKDDMHEEALQCRHEVDDGISIQGTLSSHIHISNRIKPSITIQGSRTPCQQYNTNNNVPRNNSLQQDGENVATSRTMQPSAKNYHCCFSDNDSQPPSLDEMESMSYGDTNITDRGLRGRAGSNDSSQQTPENEQQMEIESRATGNGSDDLLCAGDAKPYTSDVDGYITPVQETVQENDVSRGYSSVNDIPGMTESRPRHSRSTFSAACQNTAAVQCDQDSEPEHSSSRISRIPNSTGLTRESRIESFESASASDLPAGLVDQNVNETSGLYVHGTSQDIRPRENIYRQPLTRDEFVSHQYAATEECQRCGDDVTLYFHVERKRICQQCLTSFKENEKRRHEELNSKAFTQQLTKEKGKCHRCGETRFVLEWLHCPSCGKRLCDDRCMHYHTMNCKCKTF